MWIKWWCGIWVEKRRRVPARLLTTKSTIKNKIYDCDSVAKLAIFIGLHAMCQRLFFRQRRNRSGFLRICAVFRHIIEDVVDCIGDPFLKVCHELAPFRVSEED